MKQIPIFLEIDLYVDAGPVTLWSVSQQRWRDETKALG